MPVSDDKIQRAYRIRITIFLICAALTIAILSTVYQAIQTLSRLEVVEHDRDQWQRPADVIQALELREGSVVADTQLVATLIAVYGQFMAPIGWSWALVVWGYALAWFFCQQPD